MKKLYISCPAKGRELENISDSVVKMHKLAEVLFGEKLEPIDSVLSTEMTEIHLTDLSRHIRFMAQADYFIGVEPSKETERWKICDLEVEIAKVFNIPSAYVCLPNCMPDCITILRKESHAEE